MNDFSVAEMHLDAEVVECSMVTFAGYPIGGVHAPQRFRGRQERRDDVMEACFGQERKEPQNSE
jgi:hypothetical protein